MKNNIINELISYLEKAGVKYIFGFPAESTLPFYIALKQNSKIIHIMAGCERCAGYIADVYSRLTNTVGIVDCPGNIGTPWIIPAVVESKNSFIPLFIISSGVSTLKRERLVTGEFDQIRLFETITNKAIRLEDPSRLFDSLRLLFRSSLSHHLGPVFLEIPSNLMRKNIISYNSAETLSLSFPSFRISPDKAAINIAIKTLETAENPVVFVGGGIHSSKAYKALLIFIEKTQIPIVTTINGKGAIDEAHPLFVGVVGSKGNREVNNFVKRCDFVLIVGSKLGDKSTDQYRLFNKNCKIIRIEINAEELQRNYYQEIPLIGDIRLTLEKFIESKLQKGIDRTETIKKIKSKTKNKFNKFEHPKEKVSPSLILKMINQKYMGKAIICADASVSSGWVGAIGYSKGGMRNIITPRGSGSLGFGFPATIASKLACPSLAVFGIGGDFGFAMSSHEIETACRLNLDIHYFILKNNSLHLLEKHVKIKLKTSRSILDKRHNSDWEKIAKGYGAKGFTLKTNEDVFDYFEKLEKGPCIIQVNVNEDLLLPDFETLG